MHRKCLCVKEFNTPLLSQVWKAILTEEPNFNISAFKDVSDEAKSFISMLLQKQVPCSLTATLVGCMQTESCIGWLKNLTRRLTDESHFCRDHSLRPSAKDALNHPWLAGGDSADRSKGAPLQQTVVQRIQVGLSYFHTSPNTIPACESVRKGYRNG